MTMGSDGSAVTDLTVELAEAIADAKGVDVLDVDPLYDAVDVEALAQVVSDTNDSMDSQSAVSFSVAGCDVMVTGPHGVDVTPQSISGADD